MPSRSTRLTLLLTAFIFLTAFSNPTNAFATTYYVSTTGSDANAGTSSGNAWGTFAHAIAQLQAGDTLKIAGGTYNQRLSINKNGTSSDWITVEALDATPVTIDLNFSGEKVIDIPGSYIEVKNLIAQNAKLEGGPDGICVSISGSHIKATGLTARECSGHGIQVDGQHVLVDASTIYRSNLSFQARTASSGWGSALKVRVGADDLTLTNNKIYHNYGEGIAVTRGKNVLVSGNTVYDNYAVNIYIDNSYDVVVKQNFSYCTGNSSYDYLNGNRPAGIALAEEQYSGWGAQLARVAVTNNIVLDCNRGFAYYGADVSGGGLQDVLVAHNTFWGIITTGISTVAEPTKTSGTVIANNIIQFASGGKHASIANRTGINLHHNFWVGTPPEDWMNADGTGDKTGDVGLATIPATDSPTSLQLGSNSAAQNSGSSLAPFSAIPTDFGNFARDNQPDMGAWEYGILASPSPTPTATPTPVPSPSPTPTPNACNNTADLNNDNKVNIVDYTLLANNFMQTGSNIVGDINCDGTVNLLDYTILVNSFSLAP